MPRIPEFLSWALTFFVVLLALIFFRADSLHTAVAFTASLFNPHHASSVATLVPTIRALTAFSMAMLPVGLIAAFAGPSSDQLSRDFKPTLVNALTTSTLFVTCCLFMAFNTSQSFLYFQF
jgi:alginate O-acetyltransferase complex protein AlgI